ARQLLPLVSHTECVAAYCPDGPDQKHPCRPNIAKPRNVARTSDLNIVVYFLCSHHARLDHTDAKQGPVQFELRCSPQHRSARGRSPLRAQPYLLEHLPKAPSMRPATLFALP